MKKIYVILTVACLLFIFSVFAAAEELTDFGQGELTEEIPSQTDDLFSLLGVEDYTYEELLSVSPYRVFEMLLDVFRGGITEPIRMCVVALGILLTVTVFSGFIGEGNGRELFETLGCICCAASVLVPALDCAADCFSSIETTSGFMLSLIPILAGIVTVAGNPSLALSFNTGVLAFAECISLFIDNILTALISVYAAVCVSGVLNPVFKPTGIAALVKKITIFVLGLISGVFVAVLSIKGVIAGAADTVAVRGVRFILGNTVPVVGSAIGEALNSLKAGFSLAKNTVGMVGIAAIALINLPALMQVITWSLSLSLLEASAQVLGQEKAGEFFTSLKGLFSLLGAVVIFNSFVYIISVFIVITVKNTA